MSAIKDLLEAEGISFDDMMNEEPEVLLRALCGDTSYLNEIEGITVPQNVLDQDFTAGGVNTIFQQVSGQFLLDPNEFNAWGTTGFVDNSNTQDIGNVGAGMTAQVGGLCYPMDVTLKRFYCWHRNSNGAALPWGWRIARQEKNENSTTRTDTDILRECVGTDATAVAPRDYQNASMQLTDVTIDHVIPAGQTIVLGVESPTAVTTNYYVQMFGGCFVFEYA